QMIVVRRGFSCRYHSYLGLLTAPVQIYGERGKGLLPRTRGQVGLMIKRQTGDWTFENVPTGNSLVVRYLPQDVTKIKCNRPGKMHRVVAVIFIPHHVVFIKLLKTGVDEFIAIRVVKMLKQKSRKACQKSAGLFALVHVFQNLFAVEGITLPELFRQCGGHVFTEIVNNDALAHVGARTFVGQYPAQIRYVVDDFLTIVEAGV